jgi:hypothetical protein
MIEHDPWWDDRQPFEVLNLPWWALERASEIVNATLPSGMGLYQLPSGRKLRLIAEVAEALIEARASAEKS